VKATPRDLNDVSQDAASPQLRLAAYGRERAGECRLECIREQSGQFSSLERVAPQCGEILHERVTGVLSRTRDILGAIIISLKT